MGSPFFMKASWNPGKNGVNIFNEDVVVARCWKSSAFRVSFC